MWIKGTKTTLPFFRMLMRDPRFQSGNFTTAYIEQDLERFHCNSDYEEMIAAWLATRLFVDENLDEKKQNIDFEQGRELTPWVLNKRINQF